MNSNWIESSGWMLVASFLFALLFGKLFVLPMLLMAIAGLWLVVTQSKTLICIPATKHFLIMFACLWLPMLVSLPDAVNLPRAAKNTLALLQYPLVVAFALMSLKNQISRHRLMLTLCAGLSLYVLIICITSSTTNEIKIPVLGRFFVGTHVLGFVVAVLSPIYFYWLWSVAQKHLWIWLLAPAYIVAVLLCGRRAAWIMLVVGLLSFLIQLVRTEKLKNKLRSVATLIFIAMLTVTVALQFPFIGNRMHQTAGLFSGNYQQANSASSLRFPIWNAAVKVFQDHWINGVGPRGFRYVYSGYSEKGDVFLSMGTAPTHPHQLLLEIAAETGLIGVVGYFFAFFYWIRLIRGTIREKKKYTFFWMCACLIAMMPINAHMALYAGFWSSVVWWLIIISLAFWQYERNSYQQHSRLQA